MQVCVGDDNTCLDPTGINTTADSLTNLINISLVKLEHLEKKIYGKQPQILGLKPCNSKNEVSRQNKATATCNVSEPNFVDYKKKRKEMTA